METHIQSLKSLFKLKHDFERKKTIIAELDALEKVLDEPGMIVKKRTLDHELDLIEDIEECDIIKAQTRFAQILALEKPDLFKTFNTLALAQQSALQEYLEIQQWCAFYQIVLGHLDRIYEIRKNLGGLGFLRHFFGTRPTVEITVEINTLQKHLQNLEKPIKNAPLAKLAEATTKRWNFQMIDQVYLTSRMTLAKEFAQLQMEEKKAAEASLAAESELYRWLGEILRP